MFCTTRTYNGRTVSIQERGFLLYVFSSTYNNVIFFLPDSMWVVRCTIKSDREGSNIGSIADLLDESTSYYVGTAHPKTDTERSPNLQSRLDASRGALRVGVGGDSGGFHSI